MFPNNSIRINTNNVQLSNNNSSNFNTYSNSVNILSNNNNNNKGCDISIKTYGNNLCFSPKSSNVNNSFSYNSTHLNNNGNNTNMNMSYLNQSTCLNNSNFNTPKNFLNQTIQIQVETNKEGHNPINFISQVNEDLLCLICNYVVRKPKECNICGNMFCSICIKNWAEKNNKLSIIHTTPITNKENYIIIECPMKCKFDYNIKESIFKPVGKVVKNILYQLQIKCPNSSCEKIFTLDKYEDHEFYCFLPKCQNNYCGKGSDKQILVNYFI